MSHTPLIITTLSEIERVKAKLEYLLDCLTNEKELNYFVKKYLGELDMDNDYLPYVKKIREDILLSPDTSSFKNETYLFLGTEISTHARLIECIFYDCKIEYFTKL